jgi:cyclic pyranopterin phosphate synthase
LNILVKPQLSKTVVDQFDRPLRDLRISIIDSCNFRCPYCMPPDSAPRDAIGRASRLDIGEIEVLARAFVQLGVGKIRLTGGEPLLRRGLPEIVSRLSRIPGVIDLALTTNGSLLARQAATLKDAGLHRITVSLDTLDPTRFKYLSGGRGDVADVLAGISGAERAGFHSIKVNCVIQRGVNDADVLDILERFRHTGHVVRFIEFMDVGTCNRWAHERMVSSAELLAIIAARWPLRALEQNCSGEVASRYSFIDGGGEIGFISSVTSPFCGDCSRARIASDGQLYTCLFASGGLPLRPHIGDGIDALAHRIARHWHVRSDRYSELRGKVGQSGKRIEMFMLGG